MTHILIAGDHFVTPPDLQSAIQRRCENDGDLSFSHLLLPWPIEPFRPVDSVNEASGSAEDVIAAIGNASVAATQMAPFTAEVFDAAPELRLVCVGRGGPVNVDLKAATAAGVIVSFAPGRNAQAAAEFALGLILATARRIASSDAELHRGVWRGDYYTYESAGIEIAGSTTGLVGYGAIGRIVARALLALGATVIAADPYADQDAIRADGVEAVDIDELVQRSSIISLHARLTDESRHIIDERRLGMMPSGTILVNSARGGLLDYGPLPALLESGRLGALALDVYDVEPPPADWPLLRSPNVVLTSHLGGATKETALRASAIIADEIHRFLSNGRPQFIANPEVFQS